MLALKVVTLDINDSVAHAEAGAKRFRIWYARIKYSWKSRERKPSYREICLDKISNIQDYYMII
jgi:hypothetical protein